MEKSAQDLVIYKVDSGKEIKVPIKDESVWLTQAELAELFGTKIPAITKHISNIYKTKELLKKRTFSKMETVQIEGSREIARNIKYYNLDMIISVGYRVNSARATKFRIWATKKLREYILNGYTINKQRLADVGMDELERAVKLIKNTLETQSITSGEARGILQIITDYANSWLLFHKYDEGEIELNAKSKPKYILEYREALELISALHKTIRYSDAMAKFVGIERDDHGLERLLGTINQTYDGQDLYQSVEEKAAHLLYFVIKDHPLIDGNKRSGSLLFIHYLAQNGLLFRESGERTINDNTIVALALLVAQSDPRDKELMIKLVTNLLV